MSYITYERALEIVNSSEAFYEIKDNINGFDVSMFNYMLAEYKDFEASDSRELRGLTFIHTETESIPFLALRKFFNVDENPETSINILKDKNVISEAEKLDGSMLSFVKFPDGSVRAKTKMSFISPIAKRAQIIYDNSPNLQRYINNALDSDFHPIFEYIAPTNQIVVGYEEEKLVLLQIRDGHNGSYISPEYVELSVDGYPGIEVAKYHVFDSSKHILSYLKRAETEEGHEGWILNISNLGFVKIKTKWYRDRHGVFSNVFNQVPKLVELTLKDEIDDILSEFPVESQQHKFVDDVRSKTVKIYHDLWNESFLLYLDTIGQYKKSLALQYSTHKCFSFIASVMGTDDKDNAAQRISERITSYIIKNTNRLERARKFLNVNQWEI